MSGGERDHTPAACRLIIKGRVQGVGYRAWTVVEAQKLGLRGWVRNRRDGTVEVLAVGVTEALEALVGACRKGPAYSVVDAVDALPAEDDGSDGFRWVNTA